MRFPWPEEVARAWIGTGRGPEAHQARIWNLGRLFPDGRDRVTPAEACRLVAEEFRRSLRGGPDDVTRSTVAQRIRFGLNVGLLQEAPGPRGGLAWRLDRAAFEKEKARVDREVERRLAARQAGRRRAHG